MEPQRDFLRDHRGPTLSCNGTQQGTARWSLGKCLGVPSRKLQRGHNGEPGEGTHNGAPLKGDTTGHNKMLGICHLKACWIYVCIRLLVLNILNSFLKISIFLKIVFFIFGFKSF